MTPGEQAARRVYVLEGLATIDGAAETVVRSGSLDGRRLRVRRHRAFKDGRLIKSFRWFYKDPGDKVWKGSSKVAVIDMLRTTIERDDGEGEHGQAD